jgi:hypothetical protein
VTGNCAAVAEYALYRGDPGGEALPYPCVGSVRGPGRCLFLKSDKKKKDILETRPVLRGG